MHLKRSIRIQKDKKIEATYAILKLKYMRFMSLFIFFITWNLLYSNERDTHAAIDRVFLSSVEATFHPDSEIRFYAEQDPGHPKSFLFIKGFPINKKINYMIKRSRLKDQPSKNIIEFFVNEQGEIVLEIGSEHTFPFFCVSSRGFLPGERISCHFTTEDGNFEKELDFIPNPIIAKNKSGTVFVEAELITPFPAFYQFTFVGFQEDEVILYRSVSGPEQIEKTIKLTKENMIVGSPDVLDQHEGVGTSAFIRKTGEKLKLKLPWGIELFRYLRGEKIYRLN